MRKAGRGDLLLYSVLKGQVFSQAALLMLIAISWPRTATLTIDNDADDDDRWR
jgi:hypothetical protein